ncbi:hypothetical protein RRG08_035439 [Elysia crispata]|uniref:Uncharacterized protein n=1 Tax=Elysia crispata TaxID=231223 RepID=A0AAE0Y3S0_9GAST|nr:hypothetical protein RRG08_035439 [Elysia crispata]
MKGPSCGALSDAGDRFQRVNQCRPGPWLTVSCSIIQREDLCAPMLIGKFTGNHPPVYPAWGCLGLLQSTETLITGTGSCQSAVTECLA